MENSIVRKLRDHLNEGIDTECEVVYLLCEIRKLLDKKTYSGSQFTLRLFSHWALHVDLTHEKNTLPFLKQVDRYVGSVYGKGVPSDFSAEEHMRREFGFLFTFKDELQAFLAHYNLPTNLCDDAALWQTFLEQYAGVIEDGSISCRAKSSDLKYLKEVIFSKGSPSSTTAGYILPFDLTWTLLLSDGKKLVVDANARLSESGRPLINSGVHLH